MNISNVWPVLRMTEEELRYNAPYANFNGLDDPRPGVLRRVYPVQLVYSQVAGETTITSTQFSPSGRRCRWFATTFSGDVEWWFIQLQLLSGELLVPTTPVTALLNLANTQSNNASSNFNDAVSTLDRPNSGPLCFDPNIVLIGSQTVQVSGGLNQTKVNANERSVLNIAFHVWEFPNWGPTGTVPLVAPGQVGAPASGESGFGGGIYQASPVGHQGVQHATNQALTQFLNRTKGIGVPAGVRPTKQPIQPQRRKK